MYSATKPVLIAVGTTIAFGVRNTIVRAIAICAAAATSTIEVFDGMLGVIASVTINTAGTGYTALDVLTLVTAGGGTAATVRVDTVGGSGDVTAITLLTGGSGYVASTNYAVTGGTGGDDAIIAAASISDPGTSIGKVSVVANESRSLHIHGFTTAGVSLRVTGSAAKAYLYHS